MSPRPTLLRLPSPPPPQRLPEQTPWWGVVIGNLVNYLGFGFAAAAAVAAAVGVVFAVLMLAPRPKLGVGQPERPAAPAIQEKAPLPHPRP